jgi:hypothetical protein
MSTGLVSAQHIDLENIYQKLLDFQQQSLPLDNRAVGSPVSARHRSMSCSTSSLSSSSSPPMSSPTKYNPLLGLQSQHEAFSQHNQQQNLTSAQHNQLLNNFLMAQQQQQQRKQLDRSLSEPVASVVPSSQQLSAAMQQQQPSKNSNINPSRYKTEMCRPFEESGHCKYGDKCQFAHGEHELRNLTRHPKYKTELCRTFHTVGFCPYGPRCHFIHNEDEHKLNYIIQQKQKQALQQATLQQIQQSQQQQQLAARVSAWKLPMSRDLLGSTADSPPNSMPETPQSLSPVFGATLSDLDSAFSSAASSLALTPPPAFAFPQEFSAALSQPVSAPVPVMSPLSVHTQDAAMASLAAGLQAAAINNRNRGNAAKDSFYSPPSPPESLSGDSQSSNDADFNVFRLPIFSRIIQED